MAAVSACDIDDDVQVCDYNLQINYHYNQENQATENMLLEYVSSISEYIFDGDGILFAVNRILPDECDATLRSEHTLPPGKYSLISWGNLGSTAAVNDARVGITKREDMLLTLNNPSAAIPGYQDNCDPIYNSYRTFRVDPVGISRVRADMVHSHLVLKVIVGWKSDPPAGDSHFRMKLLDNPSEYTFMPEFRFPNRELELFDPAKDQYPKVTTECIHHIPLVYRDRNILSTAVETEMDENGEVVARFVAFRLRNITDAVVSLYTVSGGAEEQIMKDISLEKYFEEKEIDLDHALKQDYIIRLGIDGNEVEVDIELGGGGDLNGENGPGENGGGELGGNDGNSEPGSGKDPGLGGGGELGGNDGDSGDTGSEGGGELGGNDGDTGTGSEGGGELGGNDGDTGTGSEGGGRAGWQQR